jgi:RNA polymerase subunit RPABC4/transcription elongation factor Spt4
MLNFVKTLFQMGFELVLWINLILCTVGGGFIGNLISNRSNNYIFPGIIIGIVIGLFTNILMGGFTATILNMDKNLEQLRLKGLNYGGGGNSAQGTQEMRKCQRCGKMIDGGYSTCPYCGGEGSQTSSRADLGTVSPIIKITEDTTKRCQKCRQPVDSSLYKCPHCGGKEFS